MDLNSNTYKYKKLLREFGRQAQFRAVQPDFCDNITTNKNIQKQYILRNPVHRETQRAARLSCHVANTYRAENSTTGMNHAEGGWPKDVNINDPETTQRYRRKVEKEENYINCIIRSAPLMEKAILQNNALDMYGTYFRDMPREPEIFKKTIRRVNIFRDPQSVQPK